jgi:hypothetical protein
LSELSSTLAEIEADVRMYHKEVESLIAGHDDTEEEEPADEDGGEEGDEAADDDRKRNSGILVIGILFGF